VKRDEGRTWTSRRGSTLWTTKNGRCDEAIPGGDVGGKEADIVAVPGDVLKNIAATDKVRFVMKGGTIVRHER